MDIYVDWDHGQDWICDYGMLYENQGSDGDHPRRTMKFSGQMEMDGSVHVRFSTKQVTPQMFLPCSHCGLTHISRADERTCQQ